MTVEPGAVRSGVPEDDWDESQQALGGHFLQSREWAQFQAALGRRVYYSAAPDWSWLGFGQSAQGVRYLYVPYGPTALGDGLARAIQVLSEQSRAQRFDFVRMEPCGTAAADAIAAVGAQQVADVQPSHTWVLDVSRELETLRNGLERGHRSRINAAPRKGLAFRQSSEAADVESFLKLLRVTAQHGAFRPHPDSYYRTILEVLGPGGYATLHFAELEGAAVAAAISFDFEKTRYYAHAAADQEQNRKTGAAVALVWEMITNARDAGFNSFDFWGVAPNDDPQHPWAGLTHFKKSFGGTLVARAGTWDVPLLALKYLLYRGARRLSRGPQAARRLGWKLRAR